MCFQKDLLNGLELKHNNYVEKTRNHLAYTCRTLSESDQIIFADFVSRQRPVFGRSAFSEKQISKMLKDEHSLVAGVFKEDALVGTITAWRWKTFPYCTISRFLSEAENFNGRDEFIFYMAKATELLMRKMLIEKRTSFLFVMKSSHFQMKDYETNRSWLENYSPFFSIFNFSFEYNLKKDSPVEYSGYREMLQSDHADIDVVWRRMGLKAQYFKILYMQNEGPEQAMLKIDELLQLK